MAEIGHRVLFMTLDGLICTLIRAHQENHLDWLFQQPTYAKVSMVGEMGYQPMIREEASFSSG